MKYAFSISILFCFFQAISQNFEMEQIEQIWRPRLKADFRYAMSPGYKDTSGSFSYTDQSVACSLPVRTKLSAGLSVDLTSKSIKDLLKNSISINASQMMINIRAGAKQVHTGLDSAGIRNLYNASIGISGLKLTKKFRIIFYSLNSGFYEQDKTLDKMTIRANGIIGQFHLRGIRKNYYYGMLATYTDGVFFPVPFFGGSQPINDKLTFNYTLPALLSLQYKINKNNFISSGLTIDGFRYGMQFKDTRANFNYANVSAFMGYRSKISRSFGIRINTGYSLAQRVNVKLPEKERQTFSMKQGFYLEAGFYTLFGKNLFEQISSLIFDKVL